jgi:uncharacterized protein YbjT (DUF2867 family)
MRVAIFGASGRTGRHVVDEVLARGHDVIAVSRHPPTAEARPGVEWRRADVLEAEQARGALVGAQAVIVCLGPTRAGDTSMAPGTRNIIEGMRALGIARLACQTGAMVGHPPARLGWVLRRLRAAYRARATAQADDRDLQERMVEQSGLRWTLVRPTRLVGGEATPARVASQARVPSLASSRRSDVALVLVDAVTRDAHPERGVVVLSRPPLGGGFLAWWTAASVVGEVLGLGLIGLILGVVVPSVGSALLSVLLGLLAGLFEGALVGGLLGAVLVAVRPELRLRAWVVATVLGAIIGWGLGTLPSLFVEDGGAEPPLGWMLLGAAALGLVAGPVLGFFQARVLRVLGVRPLMWIGGVAVAWALGMPLVFLAASQPWSRAPMMVALLVLAGGVVGLVTGLVLVAEDRRASGGAKRSEEVSRDSGGRLPGQALHQPSR